MEGAARHPDRPMQQDDVDRSLNEDGFGLRCFPGRSRCRSRTGSDPGKGLTRATSRWAVPSIPAVRETVGSLGVPFGSIPVLSSSNHAFLETDLRINKTSAQHALTVDEHRELFRPTLWSRTAHPDRLQDDCSARSLADVGQRWFVGAHAKSAAATAATCSPRRRCDG